MSASLSAFFASVSAISLVQKACSVASDSASFKSFSIMLLIRPLALANGSSPALPPALMACAMRDASCASAVDCSRCARSRTKRTASKLAKSAPEDKDERCSTCKKDEQHQKLLRQSLSLLWPMP